MEAICPSPDLWDGNGMEWEGFRVSGRVVTYHQDVQVSRTAPLKWPHNIHGDAPEGSRDNKERVQGPRWHWFSDLLHMCCRISVRQCKVKANENMN